MTPPAYQFVTPSAQANPVPSQVGENVPISDWDPSPAMQQLAVTEMPTMPQFQASMGQPSSYSNGQTSMVYPAMGNQPAHHWQAQSMSMPCPMVEPSHGYAPHVPHASTQGQAAGDFFGYSSQAQHMWTQHTVMGPPVDYCAPSQYSAMQHSAMTTFPGFDPPAQQMNVQQVGTQRLPVNQYQPFETQWFPPQQQSSVGYQPMPYHPTEMPPSMLQQPATAHQPPAYLPFVPSTITTPSHHNVPMGPPRAPALGPDVPVKRKRGRPSNAEKARAAALQKQAMPVADAGPSLAAPPKALAPPEAAPAPESATLAPASGLPPLATAAPAPDSATLAPASGLPSLATAAPTPAPSIPAPVPVPTQETFTFPDPLPFTRTPSPAAPVDTTPEQICTTVDPIVLTIAESAPESSSPPIPTPVPTLANLVAESAKLTAQAQAQGCPESVSKPSMAWTSKPSSADSEWFRYRMISLRASEFQMATARKRRALAKERETAEEWDQEARRKQASMEFHQMLGFMECSKLWSGINRAM